ncbi:MAG: hypothetical protein V1871_09735 [Planctomycetota bacterium]
MISLQGNNKSGIKAKDKLEKTLSFLDRYFSKEKKHINKYLIGMMKFYIDV